MAKLTKGSQRAPAPVRANPPKARAKTKAREPSPDEYLDADSEVDEFANDYESGEELSSSEGSAGDEDGNMMVDDDQEEQEEGNAKWEPDEWDEDASEGSASGSGSESESGDDEDRDGDQVQLRKLQSDLGSLPLSTLAKAQKSLGNLRSSSSGSSSSQSKEDRLLAVKAKLAQMQKGKGKAVNVVPSYGGSSSRRDQDDRSGGSDGNGDSDSDAPEATSTQRGNKHAPQAMSTKRQVSRHRQVVDLHKPDRRDPRFSSVSAGTLDAHLHSQSYSFLPSILKEELSSLKQALSAAQKAERTCPWAEKPARTAERERIELQLGKVRTKLVRSERETAERDVLAKAKKEEREKRASGKGAWYMKKGEKRDLLLKARFQALEKTGGKNAVKKAMEKKRRKVAVKEKKSRPFAKGDSGAGVGGSGGERKRQRA
ncbi:rRNA biogenesis protein RRP36 [Kwoniella heveanensis BCC8398]|uniref:rRNA biogenesis protein RRP36 n=1 Tax=Kwoniella heveanensis BCC8398 TaxID=1296120 RepID=A0A1B9GWC8_9TREE|nr:rRNA biogenesis protein RRP36 [Kwoniella heveanensis BCC8398]